MLYTYHRLAVKKSEVSILLRIIPPAISSMAKKILFQLNQDLIELSGIDLKTKKRILDIFNQIADGNKLAPDDWALIQETLKPTHHCIEFFKQFRDDISHQLIIAGKKYIGTAIITFTYQAERYALLMRNEGLASSIDIKEIQWTAHGARVDAREKILLSDPTHWKLFQKVSGNDENLAYLIAAVVRRIKEMGIHLSEKNILDIHPIDRVAAGFPEKSLTYRTEYFEVDLGERNLAEIVASCASVHSSRFGLWTRCFKLDELKVKVKTDKISVIDPDQVYSFAFENKLHFVRHTSWFFLNAIYIAKSFELKPEGTIKDPWQLRNVNPIETAVRWVLQRSENSVQFSLFDNVNNRLSSAQAHAYAAKAKMNEEDLAYTSLKPERLVLHSLITQLTATIKLKNTTELEKIVLSLQTEFFKKYSTERAYWENAFQNIKKHIRELIEKHLQDNDDKLSTLSDKDKNAVLRLRDLLNTIKDAELDNHHKMIYHLCESDIQIAEIIVTHEYYHAMIKQEIFLQVAELIESKHLEPLETYSSEDRLCVGVTGPPASGKSVSEAMVRVLLGSKSAAFIGSDEWNRLLGAYLNLAKSQFVMIGGRLTLPEAWFIKVAIWEMMSKMEKNGHAPNWIQEAIDPAAIVAPAGSKTIIFLNTADPNKAAARIKERGDKYGRYVSASAATGAYRWPWLNFIKTIEKHQTNLTLKIIDSDISYLPENFSLSQDARTQLANIATFKNNVLEIYNLNHFLSFITRSYRLNPWPKNSQEIWLKSSSVHSWRTLQELDKLYHSDLNLQIVYKNKPVSKNQLFNLVNQLYLSADIVAKVRKNHVGFFECAKKDSDEIAIVNKRITIT